MSTNYVITADNKQMLEALQKQNELVLQADKYMQQMGTTIDKTFSKQIKSSGVISEVNRIMESLKKLEREYKTIESMPTTENQQKQLAKLRGEYAIATAQLDKYSKGIASYIEMQARMTQPNFKTYIQDLTKTSSGIKDLNQYYRELEKESNRAIESSRKLAAEQSKVASKSLQGRFNEHIKDLTRTGDGVKRLNQYYKELEKSSAKAATTQSKLAKMDMSKLLAFNPKNINDANAAIQELSKRRAALIRTDKDYINSLSKINQKQAVLIKQNQEAASTGLKMQKSMQATSATMKGQSRILQDLTRQASIYFSVFQAQRLVREMIKVRGEFELQNVALSAMLQNKELANEMFLQVQEMALKSPFKILELNKYLKQLKAYRIENEDLIDTLGMLGDISAGLGVSMDRLILAYGQVRAASVLRGQELRQFTEAGIPLVEQLADKFTELNGRVTTTAEVFELISNRQVSFEMIRDIFVDMTKEGGVFFDQQRLQAETLSGQLSVLRDAFDKMLNSMGKANEGAIKGAIGLAMELVGNYETVGDVLKGLIITYGTYKASILLTNIARGKEILLIKRATRAYRILNVAMKRNPHIIIATAIGAVISAMTIFIGKQKREIAAMRESIRPIRDKAQKLDELAIAYRNTENTSEDYIDILNKIKEINPDIIKGYEDEAKYIEEVNKKLTEQSDIYRALAALKAKEQEAIDYSTTAEEFEEEKNKLNDLKVSAEGYYADMVEAISKNKLTLNDNLSQSFQSIIDSELSVSEKTRELILTYSNTFDDLWKKSQSIFPKVRNEAKRSLEALSDVFRGVDTDAYADAIDKYQDLYVELKQKETQVRAEIEKQAQALPEQDREAFRNEALEMYGWLEDRAKDANDVIYRNWKGLTLAIGKIDWSDIALKPISPEKYENTVSDYMKFIDDTVNQYKKADEELKKLQSENIKKEDLVGTPFEGQSLAEYKQSLLEVKQASFDILDYWDQLYLITKTTKKKTEGDLFEVDKETLKLLENIRKTYLDLERVTKGTSLFEVGGDEFIDELTSVYGDIGLDEKRLNKLLSSYTDKSFREFLESLRDKAEASGTESGKAFAEALSLKISEIKEADLLDFTELQVEIEKGLNKISEDFQPFGTGTQLSITKIISETLKAEKQARQDLADIQDKIDSAATDKERQQLRDMYESEIKFSEKVTQQKIDGIRAEKQARLDALASTYIDEEMKADAVLELFRDINSATYSDLKRIKESLNGISGITLSPEMSKKLEEAGLNADNLNQEIERLLDLNRELLKEKAFEKMAQDAATLGSAISELGGALSGLDEDLGNTTKTLGDVISFASNLALAIGNPIQMASAIVGGLSKVIQAQAEAKQAHEDAMKALADGLIKARREYAAWVNEMLLANKYMMDSFGNLTPTVTSIFETQNPFQEAISGANAYREAIKNINSELYVVFEPLKKIVNPLIDTISLEQTDLFNRGNLQFALETVGKIQVDTERAGLFKTKERAIYSSLKDFLGVDEIDIFSEEQLQRALANYDQLDEATQALVDDWAAYQEAATEAIEQIESSLSSLTGSLVGEFGDALVDGFVNGADAADQMKGSVEGIIEAMLQQLLVSTLLAPAFSKLEQDMLRSMGLQKTADGQYVPYEGEGVDYDISDDMGRFFDNVDLNKIINDSNDLLQKWQDDFKEMYGLDIFTGDQGEKGLSRGIQSVTEDTANIIAAYLNTIRHEVIMQNGYLTSMLSVLQQSQGIASQQLSQLVQIQANTLRMANILESAANGTTPLKVA